MTTVQLVLKASLSGRRVAPDGEVGKHGEQFSR